MHYVRMTRTSGRESLGGKVGEKSIRLRHPRYKISSKSIYWWGIRAFLVLASMFGSLVLLSAFFEAAGPWVVPVMWGLGAWAPVAVFVMPVCRYLIHRWEITEKAAYSLTGWLVREWRIAPVSRVQGVNTVRGPLQRLLGLATLRVTTASEEGTVVIPGLDEKTATEAARELTEVTWRTPGDAT